MSEAVRDVTVRVNVEGGKIGKMPEFDKLTIAAENFYSTVDEGTRLLTSSMTQIRTATSGLIDEFSSIADLEVPSGQFDDMVTATEQVGDALAAVGDGFDEVTAATEATAAAIDEVAEATTAAAEASVAATAEISTATANEGKSASEIMLAKIRMSERLAAFNRKAADEGKKQSTETAAAAKKAGEEAQRQMFAAGGALAQSLAAGAQFVSTLRLIGGESKEIEELARTFAQVQGVVQGIAAGSKAFNALNSGLAALQASASAAGISIAGTGIAATATQGALIRLAPAAAVAQAALGPIAIAVAGIALAITGVMAISSYFSEEIPDDTNKTTRAYEKTTDQLAKMKRQLDANASSINHQNSLLRLELDLRNSLDGTETEAPRIEEKRTDSIKTATDTANQKVESDRLEAQKQVASMTKERDDLNAANMKLRKEGSTTSLLGARVIDPIMQKEYVANQAKINSLNEQIGQQTAAGTAAVDVPLTVDTIDEFQTAIDQLPKEVQAAYETTLKEFVAALVAADKESLSDLKSATQDNEAALKENTARQKELNDAFNEQRDVALRLQSDPTQRREIETNIGTAAAQGNLNAGIDALSGVVSTDKESELRGKLADQTLTKQQLLDELANASEFETEKKLLEDQLKTEKEKAATLLAIKNELKIANDATKAAGEDLHNSIADLTAAQQQR